MFFLILRLKCLQINTLSILTQLLSFFKIQFNTYGFTIVLIKQARSERWYVNPRKISWLLVFFFFFYFCIRLGLIFLKNENKIIIKTDKKNFKRAKSKACVSASCSSGFQAILHHLPASSPGFRRGSAPLAGPHRALPRKKCRWFWCRWFCL